MSEFLSENDVVLDEQTKDEVSQTTEPSQIADYDESIPNDAAKPEETSTLDTDESIESANFKNMKQLEGVQDSSLTKASAVLQEQNNQPAKTDTHYKSMLPNIQDAEKYILSAALIDPNAFEYAIQEGIKASDFFFPTFAKIYSICQELYEKGEKISSITIQELAQKRDYGLEPFKPVLLELELNYQLVSHIEGYVNAVKEKSILRKLISTSREISNSAFKQDKQVSDILDEAEKSILAIREDSSRREIQPLSVVLQNVINKYKLLAERNGEQETGIGSGFKDLDNLTAGFQPGELIIVAARPSMGKTAFTLNIATHVAANSKKPVGFFSLEMGTEQLVHRILCSTSGFDLGKLRKGDFSSEDFSQIVTASAQLGTAPLYIDDAPSLSIGEMRNKCRRLHRQYGLQLVIVDYLQLMHGPPGYDNKVIEIGEISRGLKSIARELNIPVIALSQLNRGVESRTDKRPMMSDLRESGAIEQDADVIAFLYREEYYLRDKTPEDKLGIAEVIISKNRNGPTGSVELKFFSNTSRFVDLDRIHRF